MVISKQLCILIIYLLVGWYDQYYVFKFVIYSY